MYSTTRATELLLQHYNIWSQGCNKDVLKYNSHKVRHSMWVLELWRNLIVKLREKSSIKNDTTKRAEIIFILHDIGRFYQNNKNNIVSDENFDHWNYWFEIWEKHNYDNQILLWIKYHNKININWLFEDNIFNQMNDLEKNEILFLIKLIRDADKLQNMIYSIYNFDEYFNLWDTKYPQWDIWDIIIEKIKKWEMILYSDTNTFWDRLLLYYCRKFNLNFQQSLDMLDYYKFDDIYLTIIKNTPWISNKSIKEIEKYVYNFKKIR